MPNMLMNRNSTNEYTYTLLIRAAYSLADAMSTLPEMKKINFKNKEIHQMEWTLSLKRLLILIDREIMKNCCIPVFYMGLHHEQGILRVPSISSSAEMIISENAQDSARSLGKLLNQQIQFLIAEYPSLAFKNPTEFLSLPLVIQNNVLDLCKILSDLIFNEFGLKSLDIAKIY